LPAPSRPTSPCTPTGAQRAFRALTHSARPVFLDLADRADLREAARGWQHRVDIRTARTDRRPADALLIRPDAHIAWAATIDEPATRPRSRLRDALSGWFGTPKAETSVQVTQEV